MSDTLRKQVQSTLLGMLSEPADVTRMAVGGCLGALCRSLPDEELTQLLIQHLLGKVWILAGSLFNCSDRLAVRGSCVLIARAQNVGCR